MQWKLVRRSRAKASARSSHCRCAARTKMPSVPVYGSPLSRAASAPLEAELLEFFDLLLYFFKCEAIINSMLFQKAV